jgi:hypothetical protein
VEVKVKYALTGSRSHVGHNPVAGPGALALGDGAQCHEHLGKEVRMIGVELVNRLQMFLGDCQNVEWRRGIDIPEDKNVVGFVHDF